MLIQQQLELIKRSRSVIVLEALINGQQIRIDEHTYALANNRELCFKMFHKNNEGVEEEKWFQADISIGGFITMCDTLSNAEICIIIGSNNKSRDIINAIHQKKKPMRKSKQ